MKSKTGWILCALVLGLAGCTTYEVRRPDGTELTIRSMREFPGGIEVDYESAQGAKLKVKTGEVRNGADSAVDALVRALIASKAEKE